MRTDHQSTIFEIIKRKINGIDSIGNVVGDVLSISQDAVYRRTRGETLLTIFEIEKLCTHFQISLDSLFELNKNKVLFDYQPLAGYDFSMEDYLEGIRDSLRALKKEKNPELIISVNNTPLIQLMNFPHLVRFKLFFWAKTHLQIPELQNELFKYEKTSERNYASGTEILRLYNAIPSKELYDPELLRGFTREIFYYFDAHHFEEPSYALRLLDELDNFLDHLKEQATHGKKFVYGTQVPANGNTFEMYQNETLNSITSIHYQTADYSGLYIAHNFMNFIHTTDVDYIEDSRKVLNKQLANSSIISIVNEKERNNYFFQIKKMIESYRKRIQLALEENE